MRNRQSRLITILISWAILVPTSILLSRVLLVPIFTFVVGILDLSAVITCLVLVSAVMTPLVNDYNYHRGYKHGRRDEREEWEEQQVNEDELK